MTNIFLSASIPLKERGEIYYKTADIVAIRDAIKAVCTVIIPKIHLVWGGHPSITPLVRETILRTNPALRENVTLYQSEFYRRVFPEDNVEFENIVLTPDKGDKEESDTILRRQMLKDKNFVAAIFIGGMEGVETEFKIFRDFHPLAKVFPIASTGGASKLIYDKLKEEGIPLDIRLQNDYAYMSLFKDLLRFFL